MSKELGLLSKLMIIPFFIGAIYFVDQVSLAYSVYRRGGLSLLVYHFQLGAFLLEQILAVVLPTMSILTWRYDTYE